MQGSGGPLLPQGLFDDDQLACTYSATETLGGASRQKTIQNVVVLTVKEAAVT
jgi:hypothetical protein